MARCQFCGRDFANTQAVRAHLKACAAYLGRSARQAAQPQAVQAETGDLSQASFAEPQTEAFDPVTKMRQLVAAERARLTLREIQQAHAELDAREQAQRRAAAEEEKRSAQAAQAAERERHTALAKSASEAEARRRAEEARERLKARRREIIQQVKDKAIESWFLRFSISSQFKAQMLQAIEAALCLLPVEELPQAELVQIAEGARDRLYEKAQQADKAAATLATHKQTLAQYGVKYATEELEHTEGLDALERWRIKSCIEQELAQITGQESHAEIRSWVDDILDREGIGFDDEDEDE